MTDLDKLPDDIDALKRIIADMARSAVSAQVEIEKLRCKHPAWLSVTHI